MDSSDQPLAETFNTIFFKACEDHQNREYESARSGYETLLRHFDDAPVLHYNLGLLLFEMGELEVAQSRLNKAACLSPEDTDIAFNLALCEKNLGNVDAAITAYLRVIEKEPESVDALYNLAGCYREQKAYDAALHCLETVLRLAPDYLSGWNNIAHIYQLQGDKKAAVGAYKKVLELQPDHASAAHMLAALTGDDVSSPPAEYVREIFDNYSERFDESLVNELEYRVPSDLRSIVDDHGWKDTFMAGLDLGCGTGLSGEVFTDIVARLDGVDISPAMIEQAEDKEIYDALHAIEIDEFLQNCEREYDFLLAADVFAYFGELKPTFKLLRDCATEDALLCFSTECQSGDDFSLRPTGRFAHSAEYVENSAGASGWLLLERQKSSLRKDKGDWIEGDLWLFAPAEKK